MRARLMATVPLVSALLASSVANPVPLLAQSARHTGHEFCRSPAGLPNLGAEAATNEQLQDERIVVTGTRGLGSVRGERVSEAPPPPPPPAPPAPAPMVAPSDSAYAAPAGAPAEVLRGDVTDATAEAPEARATSPMAPSHRRQPPRSGLLTAGEHDDVLNPELYARYVVSSDLPQAVPDIPVLDTSSVLTVEVRDANGQAVPFADVVLTCSDGNRLTLASQADGRVTFFPRLDRLSPTVQLRVRRAGQWQGPARAVSVTNAAGGQQVGFTIGTRATPVTKLDLMLVVDTTGSMGDEIRYLQSELRAIVGAIHRQHSGMDIRVGFVFYRDIGDEYVTRTVGFDRDMTRVDSVLARQAAGGGGDYPEAMDQALIRAMAQDWRPDAVKSMLLVADAPPHDELVARSWAAAEVARHRRVHIVPVAASGVADRAEYVMRGMAALTQSRYLFLTDDSGIGNPHAPPAIDCYLVTRLDALIRRVIASQISGRRVEPSDQEIIRSVGQYDSGRCILPPDFGKNGQPQ